MQYFQNNEVAYNFILRIQNLLEIVKCGGLAQLGGRAGR